MENLKGSYRTADGKAQIEWELTEGERGPEFSATGEYDGSCGQCIEEIAAAYPQDATVRHMASVWREYHLNGMNAGTPEQMACLRRIADGGEPWRTTEAKVYGGDYYRWACATLKACDLYEVNTVGQGLMATGVDVPPVYRYGTLWIYRPISPTVLAEIKAWANLPARAPLHEDQAEQFLSRNGLGFRATQKGDRCPPFCDGSCSHGDRHSITIWRKGDGKKPRRITFDFWNSLNDVQEHRRLRSYSVLACVSSDIHTPESFEDFCGEYGYDEDSIAARKTWRRCDAFARKLRGFFSSEEIEELGNIR